MFHLFHFPHFLNTSVCISRSTVSDEFHKSCPPVIAKHLYSSRKCLAVHSDSHLNSLTASLSQTNQKRTKETHEKLNPKMVINNTVLQVYLGFSTSKGLANFVWTGVWGTAKWYNSSLTNAQNYEVNLQKSKLAAGLTVVGLWSTV